MDNAVRVEGSRRLARRLFESGDSLRALAASILLACALACCFVPAQAQAAVQDDLSIAQSASVQGSVEPSAVELLKCIADADSGGIRPETVWGIEDGDTWGSLPKGVSFNSATNTLSLSDARYPDYELSISDGSSPFTVSVSGSCSLRNVYVDCTSLKIAGNGSLSLSMSDTINAPLYIDGGYAPAKLSVDSTVTLQIACTSPSESWPARCVVVENTTSASANQVFELAGSWDKNLVKRETNTAWPVTPDEVFVCEGGPLRIATFFDADSDKQYAVMKGSAQTAYEIEGSLGNVDDSEVYVLGSAADSINIPDISEVNYSALGVTSYQTLQEEYYISSDDGDSAEAQGYHFRYVSKGSQYYVAATPATDSSSSTWTCYPITAPANATWSSFDTGSTIVFSGSGVLKNQPGTADGPTGYNVVMRPVTYEYSIGGTSFTHQAATSQQTAEPEAGPAADPEAEPEAGPAADPEAEPEAGPAADPEAEPEAGPAADPGAAPVAEPVTESVAAPASSLTPVGVAKGETAKASGCTYKVTGNGTGKKATVSFSKPAKAKKSVKVPASVKLNGKSYQITGIAKGAFKGIKVKTVIVKSKKLTKKGVKGCFKGSKVKTVKVPKSKLKAYKKIFTKKNCGKAVKVVAA